MIQMSLDDPMLAENAEAVQKLKELEIYSDEELQEMYNKQVKSDMKRGADNG